MQPNNPSSNQAPFTPPQQTIDFDKPQEKSPDQGRTQMKGPRTFTWWQKEECWNNAALMIGRHPARWRLDAVGNPVFKYLKGCSGPLCHEYDHILPFSKGGTTVVENCQLLQSAVNLYKSNKLDVNHEDLRNASVRVKFTEQELDAIESAAYGSVKKHTLNDIVELQKAKKTGDNKEQQTAPSPRGRRKREDKEKANAPEAQPEAAAPVNANA